MNHTLYGDGIHDDTAAIQELLDTKKEVVLPEPEAFYLISKTLFIGSNTRLCLPRFAEIRLANGSNCPMLRNKTVQKYADRLPEQRKNDVGWSYFWHFVNECSPDAEDTARNIEVIGGIWNLNNLGQNPNPMRSKDFSIHGFTGFGMLFYNVKDLRIADMTLKDPTNFAVTLDRASYFTVENLTFDFNDGNPHSLNMDGVHLNGNCHFGVFRNLKGACRDDLVALNADEGSDGPITNILIDGIFAESCHSAVRMLTVKNTVEKIHITNIFGTYYQYCIGITKFYPGETTGYYDAITLDHIYASKAERLPHLHPNPKGRVYPLIYLQKDTTIKNLSISKVHRREYKVPIETLSIGANAVVENLILDDITVENHTGQEMPFFVNHGEVKRLSARNIRTGGGAVVNDGILPQTPEFENA